MGPSTSIYLDNNATTPLDPRVLEAMIPFLTRAFGNPSSSHGHGREARKAVTKAREQVAAAIRCKPEEIIFTSGATESNNLALIGHAETLDPNDSHIVTSNIEHKAVLGVVENLRRKGHAITVVEADAFGQVQPKAVAAALHAKTRLVSIMMANNEVGTINPIGEIGSLLRETQVTLHCDAAQALGKIPFHVDELNVDLASFSAHKVYGPKGVGALYVRNGTDLHPLLAGGTQELGLRPGTLNVPGIVGFGAACELAIQELEHEHHRLEELRNHTWIRLQELTPSVRLNGHPTQRLPGQLSLTLPFADPAQLELQLGAIALSRGSACNLENISNVLLALGLTPEMAQRTLRLEFGRFNSSLDADLLVQNWAAFSPALDRDIVET
jgi:cysteine desulfurase